MSTYISSPSRTAAILKEHDIRLSKSYGQNFLIDTNILKKIVSRAHVGRNDRVLEVGCGIGNLTEILLPHALELVCVEVDKKLSKVFRELFSEYIGARIILICRDALKLDYRLLDKEYGINKFVSNLPYKIAAPLILKVFSQAENISEAYLTVQKDIADRITAGKGDKNYSSYTVKANYLADFESCFLISRNCFVPRPNVDSSFIYGKKKKLVFSDTQDFFNFIDSCFAHRRKKLINSLQKDTRYQQVIGQVIDLLNQTGRDRNIRAEELSVEEYVFLYKGLISII
ncbi:MAG: 16S rRNA (adenine(1518)-N(6)/adenine(1519)-N(6))-dimethyltransferase RsmA [Actinomycetota bacterium]